MRSEHGGGVPQSTTFAQALDELKREGANLLVVGDAPVEAHAAASRRLLGEAEDPRKRLFVFTKDAEVCGGLADTTDPKTTRIVSQETARGSAAPDDWPDEIDEISVDAKMLTPLAMATVDAIDEFEDEGDGLEPAELRLCFDSVTSLLRDHQSENVFRLLHLVTSRVRQVSGMGHFHLRMDRDSDAVRLLEPMFDAVVEMRLGEEDPEQRWHLRDREVTSEWMAV